MKTAIRFAIGFVLVSSSLAREFRPDGRIEYVPASDTSVQQCFIFRTVPGVLYRVESTHDLFTWTAGEEIYGVGHEYAVAMREFTPPPPPPAGSGNPVPLPTIAAARIVSLRLQHSSGTAGGLVVSWRSLDDDSPVNIWLDQPMATEWDRMPYVSECHGNHYCFHRVQSAQRHPAACGEPDARHQGRDDVFPFRNQFPGDEPSRHRLQRPRPQHAASLPAGPELA